VVTNDGSRSDAEDVFQEALIILVRKIKHPDFKLTARLGTYLFSVCRLVWMDEMKKRKRVATIDFPADMPDIQANEIEDAIGSELNAKLAEKVLAELKDRCRELLLLFYNGRMKLENIAQRMGYSSGNTAKNQKYKCLESARIRLRELQQGGLTF
jgi:RNA polymerase sigma factor (sigma-70 family)